MSQKNSGLFAVQCGDCFKWRLIANKEEYEAIRANFNEDVWVCDKKSDVSCDDPPDIEYDSTRLWAIDKPNQPKTPTGTERNMSMRSDFSKFDVHYTMPNGKKVSSGVDVTKFLEAFPQYNGQFSQADFSFNSPKIPEEMVPENIQEKLSARKSKKPKTEHPN